MVKCCWRGKTEILRQNLPQSHVINHKSHMYWPGIEQSVCSKRLANVSWQALQLQCHNSCYRYRARYRLFVVISAVTRHVTVSL